MNMKQELRRAGEAVTPVLCEGAAAAWKLCGAARTKLERSVRDCIDRRNQPEMVYISVPGRLREEDIRLMMEAARSVYLSGRIPVCPYLMFPVDGVPLETARMEADRRMRFRLMDRCQTFLMSVDGRDVGGGQPRHYAGHGDSDGSGCRRTACRTSAAPGSPHGTGGVLNRTPQSRQGRKGVQHEGNQHGGTAEDGRSGGACPPGVRRTR